MKTKLNVGILTALVIGLILISMIAVGFSMVITDLESQENISTNVSFGDYSYTDTIKGNTAELVKNSTDIQQDSDWLDIVGGFFTQGFAALKTSLSSVNILYDGSNGGTGLIQDATNELPTLGKAGWFVNNFGSMILIIIFLGVVVAAILKWKV